MTTPSTNTRIKGNKHLAQAGISTEITTDRDSYKAINFHQYVTYQEYLRDGAKWNLKKKWSMNEVRMKVIESHNVVFKKW